MRSLLSSVLILSAAVSTTALAADVTAVHKTRTLEGKTYLFTKQIDAKGRVRAEIIDSRGRRIQEANLPQPKRSLLSESLQKALRQAHPLKGKLRVEVALNVPSRVSETIESGEGDVSSLYPKRAAIDGRELSEADLTQYVERQAAAERVERLNAARARGEVLRIWALRHNLADQAGIQEAVAQGRSGATIEVTPQELAKLLDANDPMVAGLELYEEPKDDIVQAMAATRIDTSALPNATTRGNGIGIYMTESGCADNSRFSNYTRLAGSETDHSRNVGGIIRTVAPGSYLYCRGSAVLPQATDLDGVNGNPAIFITTRSNSSNDTTSYNTVDRDWDNFAYNNNLIMFNSAGNEGGGTGNVTSPGKALNLVSVGNYNDANNTISAGSSFVDPETGNAKPETSGPGTNVTAGGFTMTGTSQSTPHAAAFTADMMSSSTYLQYRPYLAKAKLLAGATDVIAGGFDKVGLGGFDFASAQWDGYWQYYSGNNASFSTFDSQDGAADGYIEKKIYIPNTWQRVRVALSWMNRGSFTYDHRLDAHPIGTDLDLAVYSPAGGYLGGSYSWDNGFESYEFTPTTSGYYSFKISRYANRDTASDVRIGLYVNYFNN